MSFSSLNFIGIWSCIAAGLNCRVPYQQSSTPEADVGVNRKALFNICKKTIKKCTPELRMFELYTKMGGPPEMDGLKTAYKMAAAQVAQLEKLLPLTAKLHENVLYEACLETQSACWALRCEDKNE